MEQAWAVTEDQWAELSAEQKLAVQRARYEGDVLLELRGVHAEVCIVLFHTVTNTRHCVHVQHRFHLKLSLLCEDKQPSCPPGRNSAAAVLVAEGFAVHLLALCLCLWSMI